MMGDRPLRSRDLRARLASAGGSDWATDPVVTKLEKISARVYGSAPPSGADVAALVAAGLGRSAADALDDPDFHAARAMVSDALIRGKLLGHAAEPKLLALWRLAHVFDLVERCGRGELDGLDGAAIAALARRTIVLEDIPSRPAPDQSTAASSPPAGTAPAGTTSVDPTMADDGRIAQLRSALDELLALGPEDLVHSAATTSRADLRAQGDSPSAGRMATSTETMRTATMPAVAMPTVPVPVDPASTTRMPTVPVGVDPAAALAGVDPAGQAQAPIVGATVAVPTGQVDVPRMRLTAEAVRALSESTTRVLREARLDLARTSLPTAVSTLGDALRSATMAQLQAAGKATIVRIGDRLRPTDELIAATTHQSAGSAPADHGVPVSHGSVTSVGVGDLLVVRQHLQRYEAVDLSYVENILPSEKRSRVFTRQQTTEQTITTTTEEDKQEERDSQTAERYELQNESSEVINTEASLKAGVSVTAYGPMTEFKANADVGLTQSKNQSTKVATQYSKDVTTKASAKITEKTSEQRTVKTTDLYREVNRHGFDNTAGTAPVIGQYQFLNKVYQAQVFNYGKRVLFDLMVPKPADYVTWLATKSGPSPDLTKPDPFTLTPDELDESNYMFYVEKYGVAGVKPPPPRYTTVAPTPFEGAKSPTAKTSAVKIPAGYQAIQVLIASIVAWHDDPAGKAWVELQVGGTTVLHHGSDGPTATALLPMHHETDEVAVSCVALDMSCFTANVEIACQRTDRALDEWRLTTHAAITQAYQQQVRDYEDKLEAFQAQQATQVHGTNPAQNLVTIATELRRQAISIITAQYFDDFGSLVTDSYHVPDIDFTAAAAQGRYARFFEQAFEWDQLMYFFYPYYWAAKSSWASMARQGDDDPLFRQFLSAGFARVVVAVRPGFEYAVTHFLETGEIWDGGDLPPITSPMYLNIVEETREADGAPGTETAQGDPWEVVLPTTLIKLRDRDTLPSWVHQPDGTWVPADQS